MAEGDWSYIGMCLTHGQFDARGDCPMCCAGLPKDGVFVADIAAGETYSPKAADRSTLQKNPVQQHVDDIVDDLTQGRVNVTQRSAIKEALNNAAVGSIIRGRR